MTNVKVFPPGPAYHHDDDLRRQAGGSICPACRLSQEFRIEHLCITRGGDVGRLLQNCDRADWPEIFASLAAHPARSFDGQRLRPVDRTWCFCQCDTRARTTP